MIRAFQESLRQQELAWAAGLFDGEGCVCIHHHRGYSSIRLDVGQKDRQVLDRFQAAILDLGKIYHKNNRDMFTFETEKFESVKMIIDMLYAYLSPVKQAQCLGALRAYKEDRNEAALPS